MILMMTFVMTLWVLLWLVVVLTSLFVLAGDLGHMWLLPSYFGSFSPDFSRITLLFSTGAGVLVIVLV